MFVGEPVNEKNPMAIACSFRPSLARKRTPGKKSWPKLIKHTGLVSFTVGTVRTAHVYNVRKASFSEENTLLDIFDLKCIFLVLQYNQEKENTTVKLFFFLLVLLSSTYIYKCGMFRSNSYYNY